MELKKLQQYWNSFPEVSMEERPVLSTDLEKIVVKNPLSDAFYLRNKILIRIVLGVLLLALNIYQLQQEVHNDGNDQDRQVILLILLSYFIYFHVRLLFFADYPALLALKLMPFLHKIETILDKYILSFGIMAILSGFYALAGFEKALSLFSGRPTGTIGDSGFYKWLIILFLSVSFYIFYLHVFIPRYKKLLLAVRKYKEGISIRTMMKK